MELSSLLINPDWEPEATAERRRPSWRRSEGQERKGGGRGWLGWQMRQGSKKPELQTDTGDSHFPWTHLWVNGHLCFTFCTDLAHSCFPGAGTIGERLPSRLPASQQSQESQRAKRKTVQRGNKSTITLKELRSRDYEPISELSYSTGLRGEAALILRGETW